VKGKKRATLKVFAVHCMLLKRRSGKKKKIEKRKKETVALNIHCSERGKGRGRVSKGERGEAPTILLPLRPHSSTTQKKKKSLLRGGGRVENKKGAWFSPWAGPKKEKGCKKKKKKGRGERWP